MIHDSISPNTTWGVADTASFFRGFVQCQDEMPPVPSLRLPGKTLFLIKDVTPLIQLKAGDSLRQCKSVFATHQLQPVSNEPLALPVRDPGWILGVLIFCLLLVVFVRISFPRRLTQVFRAFATPRNLNMLLKEGNILTERITPPLILIHLLAYALVFYQFIQTQYGKPAVLNNDLLFFGAVFAVVTTVLGVRIFLVRLLGWIFITPEQSRIYLTNQTVIHSVWGIALLPLCVVIFYAHPAVSISLLWAIIFLFIPVLVYLIVRSFLIGLSVLKFSRVYLILYLCTVEILPLLVWGKIAVSFLP